jgi:nitrate reductase delta subunit
MTSPRHGVADRRPAPGAPATVPQAPEATAVVLQAASLLLDYPGPASAEQLDLVAAALAELPRGPARRPLERFLVWWRGLSDGQREQTYVATFDLDRAVTLYVTEGQPRTSRERGAALLDLRRAYRRDGADVRCDELPDYLPLMLEVAAHLPACRALLAAERTALDDLAAALEERDSPFGFVVAAVLALLPTASDDGKGGRP